MQKTLMQGDNWMEFDRYNLNKVRTMKIWIFGNLLLVNYFLASKYGKLCSQVDVAHSKGREFFYRLQQRPFSCEVPSNHYAGRVGKITKYFRICVADHMMNMVELI